MTLQLLSKTHVSAARTTLRTLCLWLLATLLFLTAEALEWGDDDEVTCWAYC